MPFHMFCKLRVETRECQLSFIYNHKIYLGVTVMRQVCDELLLLLD